MNEKLILSNPQKCIWLVNLYFCQIVSETGNHCNNVHRAKTVVIYCLKEWRFAFLIFWRRYWGVAKETRFVGAPVLEASSTKSITEWSRWREKQSPECHGLETKLYPIFSGEPRTSFKLGKYMICALESSLWKLNRKQELGKEALSFRSDIRQTLTRDSSRFLIGR